MHMLKRTIFWSGVNYIEADVSVKLHRLANFSLA